MKYGAVRKSFQEKYSVFLETSILGQGNRNNCVEGDARSKHSGWLRTSIVLQGSVSISKDVLLQSPGMLFIRKAGQVR